MKEEFPPRPAPHTSEMMKSFVASTAGESPVTDWQPWEKNARTLGLVEPRGIEPLTSTLRTSRSPN